MVKEELLKAEERQRLIGGPKGAQEIKSRYRDQSRKILMPISLNLSGEIKEV